MIGIGLVIAGIMVGVTLSGLIFGIFAAKSYDKGALDGYEQGRKDGWRASKGLLD